MPFCVTLLHLVEKRLSIVISLFGESLSYFRKRSAVFITCRFVFERLKSVVKSKVEFLKFFCGVSPRFALQEQIVLIFITFFVISVQYFFTACPVLQSQYYKRVVSHLGSPFSNFFICISIPRYTTFDTTPSDDLILILSYASISVL